MDYIKKDQYGLVWIAKDHQFIVKEQSLENYLNDLCIHHFSSVKAMSESFRKIFHFSSLLPFYINPQILLFPLSGRRSKETLYLNYFQLEHIEYLSGNTQILSFRNHHQMKIHQRDLLRTQILKCERILTYLKEAETI